MNALRKKILLVDDSKTILLQERMILGNGTWELVTAVDGEEAVERARAELPDLILMDVVMPRMNGFDACRRLRSGADTARIPVIMVTTRGEMESVVAGYESGCTDYVIKPIDAQELLVKVECYLGGGDALPS
ncbi:MAG TPA: response regulator [Thermoanaerobaculia bacterium]|nr:response regulator [Thermoanaerobaculia bacterium]